MTWATILAEIKRGLKQPASGGHWSDSEYLRRANIGQLKIVRVTKCMRTTNTDDDTVSGTRKYVKPDKCLRLMRVYYDDVGNKLYPTSITELDIKASLGEIGSPWSDNTGEPTSYYQDEELGYFYLYPEPDAAATLGKEILLRPDALENTTDVPFNDLDYMEDYHDLIGEYVMWKCLLEDQNDYYKEHKGLYLDGLGDIITNLKRPGERMDTFRLVRPRRGGGRGPLPLDG